CQRGGHPWRSDASILLMQLQKLQRTAGAGCAKFCDALLKFASSRFSLTSVLINALTSALINAFMSDLLCEALAGFHIDPTQDQTTGDEQNRDGQNRQAGTAAEVADGADQGGPYDGSEFAQQPIEAEELGGLVRGNQPRVEGAAQALNAALDQANHRRQHVELGF